MKLGNFEVIMPRQLLAVETDVEYQDKLKEVLKDCRDVHLVFFNKLRRQSQCSCGDMCDSILLAKVNSTVFIEPLCSSGCCIQFVVCLHAFLNSKQFEFLATFTECVQMFLNKRDELNAVFEGKLQSATQEVFSTFEILYPPRLKETFERLKETFESEQYQTKLARILKNLPKDTIQTALYAELRASCTCDCGSKTSDVLFFKLLQVVLLQPVCCVFCIRKFFTLWKTEALKDSSIASEFIEKVHENTQNFLKEIEQSVVKNSTKN
jgi:hypothetical protein